MRRWGNLWDRIMAVDNLKLAFWKAARGKRQLPSVREFTRDFEASIQLLREQVMRGTFRHGRFRRFTVTDPKRRLIHAPHFHERVMHHAVMNICEPLFERVLIADTFACLRARGQYAALDRAQSFARRYTWYMKMDIRSYFASIRHDLLLEQMKSLFKDKELLRFFTAVIRSYQTEKDRGLPIGSLTSQFLANHFLGRLDRFVKEVIRCHGYVRYMDDFVLWADEKTSLGRMRKQVISFLERGLDLRVREQPITNRTDRGMTFLGYCVYPGYRRLSRSSKHRFQHKFRLYHDLYSDGSWSEQQLHDHLIPLCAFALKGDTAGLRGRTLQKYGVVAYGLEPREPGRLLEQQACERPLRQPQQERPGQPEQQPGFPARCSSDPGSDDPKMD